MAVLVDGMECEYPLGQMVRTDVIGSVLQAEMLDEELVVIGGGAVGVLLVQYVVEPLTVPVEHTVVTTVVMMAVPPSFVVVIVLVNDCVVVTVTGDPVLETLTESVVVVMGGLPVTLLGIELGEELELELAQPGRTRRALMMSFCS